MLGRLSILITNKSLLGIASKRDGLIHPSVTSHPPRLTAPTGGMRLPESEFPLEKETRQKHAMEKISINLIAADLKLIHTTLHLTSVSTGYMFI